MNIGNVEIGSGHTFIIAECCSNITQHLNHLEGVVDAVKGTGADGIKIQLFHHSHFPPNEQDAKRRVEFPRELFPILVGMCRERGLAVGASVFDDEAVDLCESLGCDFLKLATREWGNTALYNKCRSSGVPVIASSDYRRGVTRSIFNDVVMMACIPEYPADGFWVPEHFSETYYVCSMGWSSHTSHWLDCIMAVTRGAVAVEKHIKFGKNDYESGWSLYPQEFAQMVNDIRWVERAR